MAIVINKLLYQALWKLSSEKNILYNSRNWRAQDSLLWNWLWKSTWRGGRRL